MPNQIPADRTEPCSRVLPKVMVRSSIEIPVKGAGAAVLGLASWFVAGLTMTLVIAIFNLPLLAFVTALEAVLSIARATVDLSTSTRRSRRIDHQKSSR